MEIRLLLDDDCMRELQAKLKMRGTDIAREGITILNWAIHESERGRVILSAEPDGESVARLAMPVLERIRPVRPVGVLDTGLRRGQAVEPRLPDDKSEMGFDR